MSTEQAARETFGHLVKDLRSARHWDREVFARLVGVEEIVIKRLEHGVPNPTRPELIRCIVTLKPRNKTRQQLFSLLHEFSPCKQRRVKVHLKFSHRAIQYSH